MQKKNKIMIAAAIGAVLVLLASSVVRCAVSRGVDAAEENNATTSIEQAQDATDGAQAGTGDTSQAQVETGILSGHAWQVEGYATKQVSFRDGYFVETDGVNSKVSAYAVKSKTVSGHQTVLTVDITSDSAAATTTTAIIISGSEGSYTVTSDGFQLSKAYVQGMASPKDVSVTGLDGTYRGLIHDDENGLAMAVASYCKNHVPTATKTTFDGEVYLDTKTGSVSATFHCDDKAATILSVTYANGAFTVTG